MNNSIVLKSVECKDYEIKIFFAGSTVKFAWLENIDKHFPDVFSVGIHDNYFNITNTEIVKIKGLDKNIVLKLCLSDESNKLDYTVCKDFYISNENIGKTNFHILFEDNLLVFKVKSKTFQNHKNIIKADENFSSFLQTKNSGQNINKTSLEKAPLNIFVIGTCFARSVFKSDSYFNPNYKIYFNVPFTAFHNSLISLMSNPIDDYSYLNINDLSAYEVFKYIEIEFRKNFFEKVDILKPEYIFLDNYIDANRPLIKIAENKYLTYSTYFSKSIYKHNFSDCTVIYPNSIDYQNLYRNAAKKFFTELEKRGLNKKLIILGGRLSELKIDELTGEKTYWNNLDYWIRPSNQNWNNMDRILLEEIPDAYYLDMRDTKWVSDDKPPIKGGASPSHYQSGYYRDILEKLKKAVFI